MAEVKTQQNRQVGRVDTATACILGLGALELLLAMRMSGLRAEQMRFANGNKAKAIAFERTTRFRSWSKAQLNNTEYAPMFAVLMLLLKVKRSGSNMPLTRWDRRCCVAAFLSSLCFCYAAATQGKLHGVPKGPGRGGMSILRPIGAMGRYLSMSMLIGMNLL